MRKCYLIIFMLFCISGNVNLLFADDILPIVSCEMIVDKEDFAKGETKYDGSAPITAHFYSNIENIGEYNVRYEWQVYKNENPDNPYITRFDKDFDYTFLESGESTIELKITFYQENDTINWPYEGEEVNNKFTIKIGTSELKVPNAFSPNNDGTNDVFKVKKGYKSIIKFHGYIFNRWGKKIYEWTDLEGGWDGTDHGIDVADGVYFCRIDAEGADGKKYEIKQAVTLLRGYDETVK